MLFPRRWRDMKMVQAMLAAIALTVSSAQAETAKCKWLRKNYQQYSDEQLTQIADQFGLSPKDRAWAKRCLGRK